MANALATRFDVQEEFSRRQAALEELKVAFSSNAPPPGWARFANQVGMKVEGSGTRLVGDLGSLPVALEPLAPYLTANFQFDEEGAEATARWEFQLLRIPDSMPPPWLRKATDRCGNFPEVLEQLSSAWPGERRVKAEVQAKYMLVRTAWKLRADVARPGSGRARLRPVAWALNPPEDGLNRLELADEGAHLFSLKCSGEMSIELTPHFLEAVDEHLWRSAERFLKSSAPGNGGAQPGPPAGRTRARSEKPSRG